MMIFQLIIDITNEIQYNLQNDIHLQYFHNHFITLNNRKFPLYSTNQIESLLISVYKIIDQMKKETG